MKNKFERSKPLAGATRGIKRLAVAAAVAAAQAVAADVQKPKQPYKLNHHPSQQGIWFPYDGGRYKDWYDLRLKTGEVIENCYPNASSWYPYHNPSNRGPIKDAEVEQIRLKPDAELGRYAARGPGRIQRLVDLFGEWVPDLPAQETVHE